MSQVDSSSSTVRRAVLVFADSLAKDLARRAWSQRLAPLLRVPTLESQELGADVHLFHGGPERSGGSRSAEFHHRQQGATFGEKLSNAVEHLTDLGYDQIVIVGRDCPELAANDIRSAFIGLSTSRVVLGPDHRGGCYLIAIHAADRALLRGIRWQVNTDLAEIVARAGADPVMLLPVKFDLDSLEDVRLLSVHSRRWRWLIQLLPQTPESFDRRISAQRPTLLERWQRPPPTILSSLRAA